MEFSVTDNGGKIGTDTMLVYVGNSRITIDAPETEKVYPNPVGTSLNVEIQSEGPERNVKLILYNSRGNKISERRINLVAATNTTTIDVTSLQPGMYILKIVYANKPAAQLKIIKI